MGKGLSGDAKGSDNGGMGKGEEGMTGSKKEVKKGMHNFFSLSSRTIAKPFEAKISRGTAIVVVVGTWLYASPWTFMPYLEVWGRFVPGKATTRTSGRSHRSDLCRRPRN